MTTYDLSHPIRDEMPVYPGDPPVDCRALTTVPDEGYRVTALGIDTHSGTHVDAPAHMLAGGRTIDEYHPATFEFHARVVDLTPLNPRTRIGPEALREAVDSEAADTADLLVLYTDWDRHWGSAEYFDHPFLAADAAELIGDWGCHVAADAPNVDPSPTENASADEPDGYPAHHALFDADRLIVENLRGLDRLPAEDPVDIRAYPLPVADGDGAPVRAIAHA